MRQVLALAIKDLRLLFRDKAGLFFTFLFPAIYASFFGAIFSGGGSGSAMKVAIVDVDQTEGSRVFIARLKEAPEVAVVLRGSDGLDNLTREKAVDLVRHGKVVAYLVLPAGFGEHSEQPFRFGPARLEMGVDPARQAEAGMLQGIMTKYMFEGMQSLFTDRAKMRGQLAQSLAELQAADDMDPVQKSALQFFLPALDRFFAVLPDGGNVFAAFQPVQVQSTDVAPIWEGPKNSYEISFPQGIIWGMMGCAAAFGISLVSERTKGTLIRLRMAPLSSVHILAGKALACLISTLSVAVLLLLFAAAVFGVAPSSYVLLAFAVLSASLAFVGVMMFLSVLGRTEQAAGGSGWAILMVMAMIGGATVPLFVMPAWMQEISHISPVKWAIYAMEGAIWRGFSPTEMLLPCLLLLSVGVVFFLVGARTFRWAEQG